jgi:hypothetical protein
VLILGRDERGLAIAVSDFDDIDQVDWRLEPSGEYVYTFLLFGDSSPVTIRGGALADAGHVAVGLYSL